MRPIGTIVALLGGLGLAFTTASVAHATTIETYDFTVTGWSFNIGGVFFPSNARVLTGSFTGVVEPDGLIEQTDLTSFSASFSLNGIPVEVVSRTRPIVNFLHSERRCQQLRF